MTTHGVPKRITLRMSDVLAQRLADAAGQRGVDRSTIVRQLLMEALERTRQADPVPAPPHDLDACARAVLTECLPEVRERITATANGLKRPLSEVVSLLLHERSKRR